MQGFNMGRYVPPAQEGVLSFNQASGKNHALGSRARKIGQGILTVRFEMPFPIWCTTCTKPTIIGQGVRFNAEKKKVGNYFSTPIYSFRMKHNVCGGAIEIRTDPKTTAYIVTEGATKRDTGEDRLREGEIVIGHKSEEEKKRLENDPFAALEEKVGDKKQAASEKSRIEELYRAKERDWEEPGEANKRLRRAFRADRKAREKNAEAAETLQEKMGLGIDLLDETEGDRRRAGFVEFGDIGADAALVEARSKPLFAGQTVGKGHAKRSKSAKGPRAGAHCKEVLRKELGNNTRAVLDPFLGEMNGIGKPTVATLPLVKRKKIPNPSTELPPSRTAPRTSSGALVDYDTD